MRAKNHVETKTGQSSSAEVCDRDSRVILVPPARWRHGKDWTGGAGAPRVEVHGGEDNSAGSAEAKLDAERALRTLQAGSSTDTRPTYAERLLAAYRGALEGFRAHASRRGEASGHRDVLGSPEGEDPGQQAGSGAVGDLRQDGRPLVRSGEESLHQRREESCEETRPVRDGCGIRSPLHGGQAPREACDGPGVTHRTETGRSPHAAVQERHGRG